MMLLGGQSFERAQLRYLQACVCKCLQTKYCNTLCQSKKLSLEFEIIELELELIVAFNYLINPYSKSQIDFVASFEEFDPEKSIFPKIAELHSTGNILPCTPPSNPKAF